MISKRSTLIAAKGFLKFWWRDYKSIPLNQAFSIYAKNLDVSDGSIILSLAESMVHSYNYNIYLKTRYWKKIVSEVKHLRLRCQNCKGKRRLEVHHLHYRTLGREDIKNDLVLLCRKCHIAIHNDRGKR